MRNFIFLMAFFCSSVFATQIPVPESPKYVNDLTGTLTNSEVNTLTNQIKALTQKNHAQLVVLVVDTTGDETIEQYARGYSIAGNRVIKTVMMAFYC